MERGHIPKYSFDTSIFIGQRHYYPPDIFPDFWKQIEDVIDQGKILATEMVFIELQERDDEIFKHVKQKRGIFVPPDKIQQNNVMSIQIKFPNFVLPNATKNRADPFVIALAIDKHLTVITTERGGGPSKVKIPYVCQELGVPCMHFFDFLRAENIKA